MDNRYLSLRKLVLKRVNQKFCNMLLKISIVSYIDGNSEE